MRLNADLSIAYCAEAREAPPALALAIRTESKLRQSGNKQRKNPVNGIGADKSPLDSEAE
jgi:hypothetical protein